MEIFSLDLKCNNGTFYSLRFPVWGLPGCSGKNACPIGVSKSPALKCLGTGRANFLLLDSHLQGYFSTVILKNVISYM